MVCDPYICIKGPKAGTIQWIELIDKQPNEDGTQIVYSDDDGFNTKDWEPYADFEREKLRQLRKEKDRHGGSEVILSLTISHEGYFLRNWADCWEYDSEEQIGYSQEDYRSDSESSRLLKRAEFLKAVCEKERVGWLPEDKWPCCDLPKDKPTDVVKEPREETIYVGDMKPGDKRDIFVDGTKVATLTMNVGSADVMYDNKPDRDYYTKEEIDRRIRYVMEKIYEKKKRK